MRAHPCPDPVARAIVELLGMRPGSCPGWQVDHRDPLCAGGADAVHNLVWMRTRDHQRKSLHDAAFCRILRERALPPNP